MRAAVTFVAFLAGCNECFLLGDARWEVILWNLPDDVDVIRVITDDRYEGERICEVIYEPLETRGDWGPGPSEPDIASMDCPGASWVYVNIAALHVNNDAPHRFSRADVTLEYTRLDGTTGGFGPITVHTDWHVDTLDYAPACEAGAKAENHVDALTGERFYPP